MKINSYQNNTNKPYGDLTYKLTKQASTPQKQQAAETALGQMGIAATDSMKKAYSIYTQSGINPTAADMKATSEFLNKAKGSDATKLETVAVASLKGVAITEENLGAVHSALNDSSNETLTIEGLSPEIKEQVTPEALKQIKLKIDQLPPAVKQRLLQTLTTFGMSSEAAQSTLAEITSGSADAYNTLKAILPDTVLAKINDTLQIEALKQLLDQSVALTNTITPQGKEGLKSLEDLAGELINMKLPDEATLKAWLNQLGQEKMQNVLAVLVARAEKAMAGSTFGVEPKPTSEQTAETPAKAGVAFSEPDATEDAETFFNTLESWLDESIALMASGYGSETVLNALSSDIKRFIVTETTVEMVKAKAEFDTFKAKALEQIKQVVDNNPKALAQVVTKVAEKLDHLIMHTDLGLYTDMKTERKLMGLSSDLQTIASEAQGQPEKALNDLKQLTKKLEALVFNPTKEKVVLKLSEKAEKHVDLQIKLDQPRAEISDFSSPKLNPNGSAKGVLDLLRQLGLNREPELMDELFSMQKELLGRTEEKKETFKELLMQLSKSDEGEDEKLIKAVEKGIAQLTGQQLLNRPEPQNESQNMFFNIPLEGQNQEMKLFVKARKSSNRMDWENCSLYVLVDLKQYGETGIRVNVSSKQLSVTISNESAEIMDVLKPIAEDMIKELQEVGYLPSEVKYSPFMRQKASEWIKPSQEQPAAKVEMAKGGFEWQV